MQHLNLMLLIGLAAVAFGLGLGYVLRRAFSGRMSFKKLNPADYFKAVLLTVSAIATGGILGCILLVELPGPVNMAVFAIACWAFGEIYYRIFLKVFKK